VSDGAIAALQQAQEARDQAVASTGASVGGQPWSAELVTTLTLATLGFTLVVIFVAGVLLWRAHASPGHVLRTTGILSILGLATLLLVAGYGNEQLTPIVGLFGAIAGYLLGRDSRAAEAGAGEPASSRASRPPEPRRPGAGQDPAPPA
jgi:uncharacterized YccA/Bax inhibitor family protein